MEKDLFLKGIRPAVNIGSSVSRIGSRAQPDALRVVTKELRFDLAQYRESAIFAQFDSDIDSVTKGILEKGQLFTEILKQKPHEPLQLYQQVIILLAAGRGYVNDFIHDFKRDMQIVSDYESELLLFLRDTVVVWKLFAPMFKYLNYVDAEDFVEEENFLMPSLEYWTYEYDDLLHNYPLQ